MKLRDLKGRTNSTGFIAALVLVVLVGFILLKEGAKEIEADSRYGSFVFYESFPSEMVPPRPIDVWLPPEYDQHSATHYPVIYMHDGQLVFKKGTSPFASFFWKPFDWYVGGMFFEADKIMTKLIRENKIRPAIIVSVWFLSRASENMPQKPITEVETSLTQIGDSDVRPDEVISDNYLKFLVEELKPFVDSNYRTLPDKMNTYTMGASMGGSISAYALSEYPDVFGAAACLSTEWAHGDGAEIDWYERHWPEAGSHRLYFDYGTETYDAAYEPYQKRMDDVMRSHGFIEGEDWVTRKFDGADHSPKAWRERLHIPLTFLLGH